MEYQDGISFKITLVKYNKKLHSSENVTKQSGNRIIWKNLHE